MLFNKSLATFGRYLMLMGRTFSRPERMRMFFKQYIKEMSQLGVDSIGIVLLISFFIGAVICIQIKLNIQSPWMPKFVTGYTTRGIFIFHHVPDSGREGRFQHRLRNRHHARHTANRRP